MKTGDIKRLTPMGADTPYKKELLTYTTATKTNITTGYTENYNKNNTMLHQKLHYVTNSITTKHKRTLNYETQECNISKSKSKMILMNNYSTGV